jgi:SNF2 family DNA or RNA helicase
VRSYGTITLSSDRKFWQVQTQPHVAQRLKRVFGRVRAGAVGTLAIANTIETSRELLWFTERYPMQIQPAEEMDRQAKLHLEREAIVAKLLQNLVPPQSFDLAVPPRPYQATAASIALANGGLLLADDVGLGKTASAICVLAQAQSRPAVVVTLAHLTRQWQREITKFAPGLSTHIVKQSKPYDLTEQRGRRGQMRFPAPFPDVVILNYHKLSGWAETLSPVCKAVVFDEAQELRRPDSDKYAAAKLLAEAVQIRIGLSATPIYNHGSEMYSVLNCLFPGALGTNDEFRTEWCIGDTVSKPKAFGAYLRDQGYMLRRTRQDVGRELPACQTIAHHVDCDAAALDKVSRSCAELAKLILAQGESHRGAKMLASEELSNQLRQATGIAKAPYVAEFVRLLVSSGESVVLYGWHRDVYSIWLDRLADLAPVMYTGSESAAAKDAARLAFVSGERKVIIISLRSGAGLDGLQQVCRTVVFGELDWSPGVHEQCIGRVSRDGQADPVAAYFLISEEGSDPIMAEVLGLKREQSEGIRDPQREVIERLQSTEGHIKRLAEEILRKAGE